MRFGYFVVWLEVVSPCEELPVLVSIVAVCELWLAVKKGRK